VKRPLGSLDLVLFDIYNCVCLSVCLSVCVCVCLFHHFIISIIMWLYFSIFLLKCACNAFCYTVSVVMPPTSELVTNKCVYHNPLECPPATCNKTVEECGEPVEGKRWHCYALWTNKTGRVSVLMSGCWIYVEKCIGQLACVSNDMSRTDENFCCCDGDLCNAKVYDSGARSSPVPDTNTPGE